MKKCISLKELERVGYGKIEVSCLPVADQQLFLRRRKAVELRLDGVDLARIFELTGIPGSEVCRFMDRFCSMDSRGGYQGENGLVPNRHIKKYSRSDFEFSKRTEQRGGLSGIMDLTLRSHPGLLGEFAAIVLQENTDAFRGLKYKKAFYYAEFIRLLRDAGVKDTEWPFCLPSGGKRSVLHLVDSILAGDFESAVTAMADVGGRAHIQVGTGDKRLIEAITPYDVVQLDAYYVDGHFTILIEPTPGIVVRRLISRFWMIAAVESCSECVLAKRLVFRSEVSAQDAVDVLADAIIGDWQPIENLTVPGLKYAKGAGMPCYVIPNTKKALWGSLYLDNAMQHHANIISQQVRRMHGFSLNFGQLRRPERRSEIEGLFKQFCSRFIHLLPSSTGSHPHAGRSDNSELNALRFEIDINEAEQVLDVFVAQYNATPRSGHTFSLSPLEMLAQHFNNDDLLFPCLMNQAVTAVALGSKTQSCVIRGDLRSGRRPYIQLDRARYTSPQLSSRPDLIGIKVTVIINPKDYRSVDVYLSDGRYFGVLNVLGVWGHTRHSVTTRKLINNALDKQALTCAQEDDIVLLYRNYLLKKKTKEANLELWRLEGEIAVSSTAHGVVDKSTAEPARSNVPKRMLFSHDMMLTVGQLVEITKKD
ncbi:hypothetical protein JVX91_19410 [Pseudomonas sp. PDNC002]|uniref:hypothetical protein n=1 Tax=Pseudomonas sp. PDNC002 TaxID=2811422 RepID=UPI001964BE15|nr:hypothetical protein [Pseudomonas sp. PDNC002]QRY77757.1 hypothetical protein JVX91_19410 [Pseudomonas sp. PDNC002]